MSIFRNWREAKIKTLVERTRTCELAREVSNLIKKECGQDVHNIKIPLEKLNINLSFSRKWDDPSDSWELSVYPKTIPDSMECHWDWKLSSLQNFAFFMEGLTFGIFLKVWEDTQE